MSTRAFLRTAGVIFGLVSLLHLLRLLLGWDAVIGGWSVPAWYSWLAAALGAYLSYTAFKLAKPE